MSSQQRWAALTNLAHSNGQGDGEVINLAMNLRRIKEVVVKLQSEIQIS